MTNPREKFDQALKKSIKNPYNTLLSFSIDRNGVTILQLFADLLKNETMFVKLLTILKVDLPTSSLQVALQPHQDLYDVEERFTRLRDSLKDIKGIQITRVPYQENGTPWKRYLLTAGAVGVGAVATPYLVTAGIGALGFTAAGITANTAAAGIMSTYAGAVAPGSVCAVLQSIGAAGLGAAGTTIASSVGAIVTGVGAKVYYCLPRPCL